MVKAIFPGQKQHSIQNMEDYPIVKNHNKG